MNIPKVNLLHQSESYSRRQIETRARFFLSPLLVVIIFSVAFGFGRFARSEAAAFAAAEFENVPVFNQMRHLVMSSDRKLIGENDDRINVLLLGMGGEGHEGPYLTDTLIVASLRPSTNTVALLSIPRDTLIPIPKHGWRKINAANAFGELEQPGKGSEYTRRAVEGLLGINIPYTVRIDFNGFTDLINALGGVDVYVDRSFTDPTYPTKNFGIQVISFQKGWTEMDGETALQFARSRHGTNGEGSDFARAERQQKIINAAREKILSTETFMNPVTIVKLFNALEKNVTTNLSINELIRLTRLSRDINPSHIHRFVLSDGPTGQLVSGIVNGAYVLVPKNNDWNIIRDIAKNIFTVAKADNPITPPVHSARKETVIEIQNGNGKQGNARTVAETLTSAGFIVARIGNADTFSYTSNILYDLTDGKKESEVNRITTLFTAERKKTVPASIRKGVSPKTDFILILGGQ